MSRYIPSVKKSDADRLQPHNMEAEDALLGSLLIDSDAILRVASFITPKDFFSERNGWIYAAIRDLHEQRKPSDLVTLSDELERRNKLYEIGGPAHLANLINATPTSIHAEHYAHIIERTALLRRLIEAASQIAVIAYEDQSDADEIVDRAEELIFNVSARRSERDVQPVSVAVDKFLDNLERASSGALVGIPSGLTELDRVLGGFHRSDFIVMAARPGMGKTSWLLDVVRHATRQFLKNVAIFSLEMSDEQLVQRLVSKETSIDVQRLRLGRVTEDEWPLILQASSGISNSRYSSMTPPQFLPTNCARKCAAFMLNMAWTWWLLIISN